MATHSLLGAWSALNFDDSDDFGESGGSDCYDGSDEDNCGVIQLPKSYSTTKIPAVRYKWHNRVLKMPVFGDMILKSLLHLIQGYMP